MAGAGIEKELMENQDEVKQMTELVDQIEDMLTEKLPDMEVAFVASASPTDAPGSSEDAAGLRAMEHDQAMQDAAYPTDGPALDEAFRKEDAVADASAPKIIGFQDRANRLFWHGVDILGNKYLGSGVTSADCYAQGVELGAVTCHLETNPDFIEPALPEVEPELKPISAFDANDFYTKGFADGDAAYQDIKLLVLSWVTDQMLSSNLGAVQDIDSLPFVVYARHNR